MSFNINGLRARPHQLKAIIDKHNPDILGLQEIKVHDEQFPKQMIDDLGYQVSFFGQKSHYGVALLYKKAPIEIYKGFPEDDANAQRRFIYGKFPFHDDAHIWVLNGYFPQGENQKHPVKFPAKRKFYADLLSLLKNDFAPQDQLVLMGDMNISPQDLDIGIGENNRKRWLQTGKCSFLPEERAWLNAIKDLGFVDSFRQQNPEVNDKFSWFDYRSRGFEDNPKRGLRIDLLMVSNNLVDTITDVGIDYELRGIEKPSDHAPIWLNLG